MTYHRDYDPVYHRDRYRAWEYDGHKEGTALAVAVILAALCAIGILAYTFGSVSTNPRVPTTEQTAPPPMPPAR